MAIKFGTDGWRAVISDEFTFDNVRKVAAAIAAYVNAHKLASKGVVVGYDTRFLADRFAEETVKVLNSRGIPCSMTDRDTPTPVVAYSVKDRKAAGAVMLTASHNPPQYCGMKFIPEYGGPAFQNITDEIVANLSADKGNGSKPVHAVERFNPFNRYSKRLEELIDLDHLRKSRLKVGYDPLWGTGRDYLDRILQGLGIETEVIHGNRDVLFGGITPEPIGEHLTELRDLVISKKYSAGLATDPDADRFGLLDENGEYISANKVIAVLFAYLVEKKGATGSAVRSIATTSMIDAIGEAHGLRVHETPVGFKHIAEIMMKEQVIIGGEESGGLTIGEHIPEKDGILANLLICEMISVYGEPLSRIVAEASKKYGEFHDRRVNLKLTDSAKNELIETLGTEPPAEVAGARLKHVMKMDGVKMLFADGSWILARASGTEPIVRTYYEASSQKQLNEMVTAFETYVGSVIGRKYG